MLSEIQSEFDKIKEKDSSVKKSVSASIQDLRKVLVNFKNDLEEQKNSMTVIILFYLFIGLFSYRNCNKCSEQS